MPAVDVYADTRGKARCRDCQQLITWYTAVTSGRRMCFDGEPVALRTAHDGDRRLIETLDLDEVHWKTCPEADRWKRPLFS